MRFSDNNTFEKIMSRMLERDELVNVDKRQGSIIYDALAPCAMELAEAYVMMDILQEQTYLMTATGANLDKRCYDYGVEREPATKAKRIGSFKQYKTDDNGAFVYDNNGEKILVDMEIPVGSRFSALDNENLVYKYIGKIDGYEILECESAGSGGNTPTGTILPLTPISKLVQANIISTYEYADDEENDDDLRARVQKNLVDRPFGGNIADYVNTTNEIEGVGQTKVFPAWQEYGSVLLSIVDPNFNPCSPEFIASVKRIIDPEEKTGQGVGTAPIGHYVTVTTPVKKTVDVSLKVKYEISYEIEEIQEAVEAKIEEYFMGIRKQYKQDVDLSLYRARIVEKVLELQQILNIPLESVKLNGTAADITYTDEGLIGYQYLPYLGEVRLERD